MGALHRSFVLEKPDCPSLTDPQMAPRMVLLALLPLVVLPVAAYREALGNPNSTFRVSGSSRNY